MRTGTNWEDTQENIHSATSPKKCFEMEYRYGWKLKDIRKTRDSILKVDCVFYGKQTSFEDERYETDLDYLQE
ncbi:hypothetical protein [Argonema galeatum]|uniref:hypothetical protein n=1 Tax=Argonema galeatum TaxID=2942762 RepID=UPI002012F5E1|nr:hypothetical protein [Argonema galeatum]MCL1466887.1 hypothetical protein [Argonema galeatum A003/A1]